MHYIEIQKGKERMKEEKFYKELGAGASYVKRMALAVDDNVDNKYDGLFFGDTWFGSMKAAVQCAKAGKKSNREEIFVVKGLHALYPKKFIQDSLTGLPGGIHIVLEGVHPATGVKLITLGYKYSRKTTLFSLPHQEWLTHCQAKIMR